MYVYNCRAAEEYYYQALAIYEANPDVSPAQVLKVKCPSSVRTHFLRDLRMFNSCICIDESVPPDLCFIVSQGNSVLQLPNTVQVIEALVGVVEKLKR